MGMLVQGVRNIVGSGIIELESRSCTLVANQALLFRKLTLLTLEVRQLSASNEMIITTNEQGRNNLYDSV
jgi:hypothetical protein